MAGTNLAFSYVVLLGLRQAGVSVTEQEEADYLHHINVVGWLNGVDGQLLPQNMREAYRLGQAIGKRQFRQSEAGEGLTRSLLNAIAETGSKTSGRPDTIRNLAAGEMRFFLGDRNADLLGIPSAPIEKRLAGVISRLPIFDGSVARLG
ncbi:oxygenase MpaB family protein [Spirosoma rhododendri]|uniref:oxygenase MpaB family protein n=1 Tax=Spirosoma rhododendri TaxID=2728024 RepID=UPI002FCDDEF2